MRVIAIAREALALPADRRETLLRERCGEDGTLRASVEAAISGMVSATLVSGGGSSGMADAPESGREVESSDAHEAETVFGIAGTSVDLFESGGRSRGTADVPVGTAGSTGVARIGQYRILGMLGEGGMGVVYLAEQERPRRTVAIKVVRPGMMGAGLLKRFELEAQMLGRLQHPNIAQVYEAGMAQVGGVEGSAGQTPFFAMEYIRGAILTEHAERRGLGVRERLALMVLVCDAVQHAHTRGVIHRDLKPANILVDEQGQPKILDFGIARATDGDLQATQRTDVGQLLGTLPYMSPEQIAGDPGALDTRSDVYTLGVILYQLLSGRLPHELGTGTVFDAARAITHQEARSLGTIDQALRGDISTIVAKAIEKSRERRYQTASELAADIGRYLRNEPIAARPASAVYQMRKFAARNKGLVAGASAAVLLLVLGIAGTSLGMMRAVDQRDIARQQRERADDEAGTAKAVNDFLINRMLTAGTPEEARGKKVTVDEVLDKAAGEVDDAFKDRPKIKGRVYDAIGRTYASLGDYGKAERFMAGAVELRRENEPGSNELGSAIHQLGSLRFREKKWGEAAGLFREAGDVFAMSGASDAMIESKSSLAACLRNLDKPEEAQRLQEESVSEARARLGAEHAATLTAIANLAIVLHDKGQVEEARKLYQEVADTRMRTLGMSHPSTLTALGNLATALFDMGDIEGAERAQSQAVEVRKRVSGADHPETLIDLSNLAVMREKLGRIADAEAIYREVMEAGIRRLGEENESVAITMSNLAANLGKQGKSKEAEDKYLRSTAILVKVNGPEHAETIQNELGYGRWLLEQGRINDAGAVLERVHATAISKFGEKYPASIASAASLASVREKQGRFAEALPLAEKALAGRRGLLGEEHPAVKDTEKMVERIKSALR